MRGDHKPTVLVVDDNADTRVVVRWMLERWGCLIVEASDGREAYEMTVEHRPYDAIRRIRGREESASLPVIAVTAFDRADARDGASAAGCNYFLSKPIDYYRLQVLVERLTRPAREGGA
jgi:CheY-like chemotaxis protein